MFTGLAKFSVLNLLIVGGYDSITLSEMDVFWFSPPWAPLLAVTHSASLLCMDNYPAATHADNAANIGLIHIRRPHGNDGFARRFLAHFLSVWRERLLATAGAAGLVVCRPSACSRRCACVSLARALSTGRPSYFWHLAFIKDT